MGTQGLLSPSSITINDLSPKRVWCHRHPPTPRLMASLLLAEARTGAAYILRPMTELILPSNASTDFGWSQGPA